MQLPAACSFQSMCLFDCNDLRLRDHSDAEYFVQIFFKEKIATAHTTMIQFVQMLRQNRIPSCYVVKVHPVQQRIRMIFADNAGENIEKTNQKNGSAENSRAKYKT